MTDPVLYNNNNTSKYLNKNHLYNFSKIFFLKVYFNIQTILKRKMTFFGSMFKKIFWNKFSYLEFIYTRNYITLKIKIIFNSLKLNKYSRKF